MLTHSLLFLLQLLLMSPSIPLLPLCAALLFLNAQKDGTPGKTDGKSYMFVWLCLYLCSCTQPQKRKTYECVFFVRCHKRTCLHFLFICTFFSSSLSSQVVFSYVELCMDCLHGFPPLIVTLTTVSIDSLTYTAIKSSVAVSFCRAVSSRLFLVDMKSCYMLSQTDNSDSLLLLYV